ncbi:hypothetical protein NITGR_170035 [Nitrospina gracilis 3/211]|uniref:Uncharacterized protein n=1 Tax=Nitrospina gracilis (strain 3/211) TaxID=1266370 RepID=M1YWC0_NITG3|nr:MULTISPECIES: tetratricopeptide repeat protein [Nitrospina]MCF8722821.1 tetratricopeptide (TPR) repeat protein [Nitrospina sp. Nb-3]CCQ89778.1 hypothetical protein NITGR_170035 [Nitrospina gracilis 3/211]
MIRSISFCVMPISKGRTFLKTCLESIAVQGVQDYEILIDGPGNNDGHIRYLPWSSGSAGSINQTRNRLCASAQKEHIVLIDASLSLAPDWFANLRNVTWLDVIGSRLETKRGGRGIDWSFSHTLKSGKWVLPLEYEEWLTRAFVNCNLVLFRKAVWERVGFEENRSALDGSEDFCLRAAEMGYRVGIASKARGLFQANGSWWRPFNPGKEYDEARKVVGRFRKTLFEGSQQFLAGQYEQALDCFHTVLEEDPDNIDVLAKTGLALRNTGKAYEAIETFNHVLAAEPGNKVALRGRGWAYLQLGDAARAIPDLQFVMQNVPPGDYGPWLEAARGLATALGQTGDTTGSIQVYQEILEKLPRDFVQPPLDVYQGLGEAQLRAGNPALAEPHLAKALALAEKEQPALVPALKQKLEQARQPGIALLQSGQFEQALKLFLPILENEPGNPDIRNHVGWAMHNLGRYAEAIDHFNIALETHAGHLAARRGRGWAQLQSQQHESALADLLRAFEETPVTDAAERLEAARGLGWAQYHCGHFIDAINTFENVLQTFPKEWGEPPFDVYHGLGHACFQAGRMADAKRHLARAKEKADPTNTDLITDLQHTLDQAERGLI